MNVLNAGSLPAALTKEPISELYSGATLGSDTITKSLHAMLIASILVPLFMLVYYRFSGVVAVVALVLNMLILFAVMLAFKAAFTLTGFAGLALTVGMAVDNNILVFERLREEHDRGATLRMAIRNAFHRAGTTIIDCNLTHMIAATVLWFLGTDQLKGFAVTLWLGVVTSMYTSVFVSHVIFDIAEKRQWIRDVKMLRWVGHTNIDFMSWFPYCLTVSVLITIMAIGVSFVRGKGLFDIDFTGGVSVQAVFDRPQKIANGSRRLIEPKERLPDLAISDVQMEDQEPGLQFIINTSEPDPKKVQDKLKRSFSNKLAHNSFDVTGPETIRHAAGSRKPRRRPRRASPAIKRLPQESRPSRRRRGNRAATCRRVRCWRLPGMVRWRLPWPTSPPSLPPGNPPSRRLTRRKARRRSHDRGEIAQAVEKPAAALPVEVPSGKGFSRKPLASEEERSQGFHRKTVAAGPDAFVGGSRADLTFKMDVNYETVEQMLKTAMKATGIASSTGYEFSNPDYVEGERVPFHRWTLKIMLPPDKTETLLAEMQKEVAASPVFPASSQIGGAVAGEHPLPGHSTR